MADESNPRAVFKMSTEHGKLAPPSGNPLIVHVVVNIEYWSYDQRHRAALSFRRMAARTSPICRTSAGRNTATAAACPGCSNYSATETFR